MQVRESTLALKPRRDVTRKPKAGVSVAPQKGLFKKTKYKVLRNSAIKYDDKDLNSYKIMQYLLRAW